MTRRAANYPGGQVNFSANESGYGFASFVLGYPDTAETPEGYPLTIPIQNLWAVLEDCQNADWGNDDVLGKGTLNVGVFRGGQAANIVPPQATASIMIRTVEPRSQVEEKMRRSIGKRASMEIIGASDPLILHVVDGFATTVVSFGSDAPHLGNTGKRLLIGPGSILDAHTAGEKISKRELVEGIDLYERLVRKLLA